MGLAVVGVGLTATVAADSSFLPATGQVQLNATAAAQANIDATATAAVAPRPRSTD